MFFFMSADELKGSSKLRFSPKSVSRVSDGSSRYVRFLMVYEHGVRDLYNGSGQREQL